MVSGTNDRYLTQKTAIRLIWEKVEPNLIFTDFTNQIREDDSAYVYQFNSVNKSSDPKKETPPKHVSGSKFPELDISQMSTATGLLNENGFSVRIPKKVMRNDAAGRNSIMRAFDAAGFWFAEWTNTNTLSAMTSGATTPTWAPNAVWSDPGATPVDDMILFEEAMEQEGLPFALTDVFMNSTGWFELKRYLTSVDIGDAKQKEMYGVPEIGKDNIHVPVVGADMWKVKSGMTDGYVLGLDRNNTATETHYFNDPEFSVPEIKYQTIVNGAEVTKTAPNIGIHFDQFKEQDSKDTILQFWIESDTVVIQPLGLMYDNGI